MEYQWIIDYCDAYEDANGVRCTLEENGDKWDIVVNGKPMNSAPYHKSKIIEMTIFLHDRIRKNYR